MRAVDHAAGQGPDLAFGYGAGGQRISKQVGGTVGDPGTYREHYIRDAQGNIMATYRLHPNGAFRVQERPIYGSSRVGLYAGKVDLYPATQLVPMPQVIPVFDALLRYELTDHLGNVGTVVTGRLLPGDGAPHEAEVISAQGYEPFGSLLPGRNYSSDSYRFGFNGKPKDDEIHGSTGTTYDFGARLYDPRVGRWLSLDPLAAATPAISAYTAFSDNPIEQRDHDGRFSISNHYKFTSSALQALGYSEVMRDLISHYASTYADNPGRLIAWQQGQSYRKGIDYSRTSEAQNTASIANSTWHAMKADGENILNIQAMWRGQEFGWSKVIEAGSQAKMVGGVSCLTENSAGIQALGQGIHALQDAIAHRGTDMKHHSISNDMNPSLQDKLAARTAAYNAVLVAEVVSGDYRHVSDGMTVNLEGATQAQFAEIKQHFDAAIAASDGKVKSVNFTGMRKK